MSFLSYAILYALAGAIIGLALAVNLRDEWRGRHATWRNQEVRRQEGKAVLTSLFHGVIKEEPKKPSTVAFVILGLFWPVIAFAVVVGWTARRLR